MHLLFGTAAGAAAGLYCTVRARGEERKMSKCLNTHLIIANC
jgi:hypothetical protein